MTTIGATANATVFARPSNAFDIAMRGAALNLTASIMGSFLRPLGAGPFASAQLPSAWTICTGSVGTPPQPQITATVGAGGKGNVDLGDGYTLQLNENNSEITIHNAATGETTRIWGDPHVEIDGKQAFDFWGTTTFTLDNGTKITINTEQFGNNPNAFVASQLVITRGTQAVTVDGISQNDLGDLSVTVGSNGRALDATTRDGYTLTENSAGAGWRAQGGHIATQADLNATAVGGLYGPGSTMPSLNELSSAITSFLFFGALVGAFTGGSDSDAGTTRSARHSLPR
ncbi:DUF1521 domain-containing protein [Glacieibacterium frigidum]|uniref:DUF1521 domain-containing protein n=1 Tax=Glacieibacterium frigidum TaxID=2593303 RepID=A0A552UHL1_9SPHN|nr:DUF1521 domain-containing protein [Glacieibacterium frigidum]TRW17712.1 DUF1521 domain-containing protein [Glacieibacterium frigidum]